MSIEAFEKIKCSTLPQRSAVSESIHP